MKPILKQQMSIFMDCLELDDLNVKVFAESLKRYEEQVLQAKRNAIESTALFQNK